jgi:hypothetical protein
VTDTDTPNELDGRQEPGGGGGGPQARSPQCVWAKALPVDRATRSKVHILIEQLIFFIFSSLKKA